LAEFVTRSEGSDEVREVVAEGFRLVFLWDVDRWAHALIAGPEGQGKLLVRSFAREATADDPRQVAEPAFQQLHFQHERNAALALLVGQSGSHHFSASFRIVEDAAVWVEVDVADRHTRASDHGPLPLACPYVVDLPFASLQEASHKLAVWACREPQGRLSVAAQDSAPTPTLIISSEASSHASLVQPIAGFNPEAPAQRCRFTWCWERSRS
jgi:hypothetical protein